MRWPLLDDESGSQNPPDAPTGFLRARPDRENGMSERFDNAAKPASVVPVAHGRERAPNRHTGGARLEGRIERSSSFKHSGHPGLSASRSVLSLTAWPVKVMTFVTVPGPIRTSAPLSE